MTKNQNTNFNKSHPEMQEGEYFLTNSDTEYVYQTEWKTMRYGEYAYDSGGHRMKNMVPVFVQISEREEKEKKRCVMGMKK